MELLKETEAAQLIDHRRARADSEISDHSEHLSGGLFWPLGMSLGGPLKSGVPKLSSRATLRSWLHRSTLLVISFDALGRSGNAIFWITNI